MENRDIEKELEHIKIVEKKGNRLGDDKLRKKKRKKEKMEKDGKIKISKKKVLITILSILALIILVIGIVAGTYIYKADGDITTAALNMAADVLGEDDPIFVLILGLSEDISAELTDTIILAGYNPDSQKAFMLSIPRDTFIGINEAVAGGYDKINSLYQKGPEKTVAAVEKLTGIDIAHYVLVKNSALPAIVSAIGEVEFNVPINMDYDDPTQNLHIHLKAGTQMIDGNEAEQLLRFRHNNDGSSYPSEYGDNDYGRMRTQREFIKAVASQLLKGNSLSNLKGIASAVFQNVVTDMSLTKILGYAPSAVKLNIDSVRMEQLPGASDKINNLWFYRHNYIETYDLVNELLTELELDEKEMKQLYTPTKRIKNTVTKNPNTINSNTNTTNTTSAEGTIEVCEHENEISKVKLEPTCESKGEEIITCTCGKTETREIPATDHNIRKVETVSGTLKTIVETCTNKGCTYSKTTTKNIESSEQHKHSAGSSKILVEPTCTKDGTRECTCDCGEVYEETITKTEHTLKKEIVSESSTEIKYVEYCTKCDEYKEYFTETKTPEPQPEVTPPVATP